jgi:hypothetical protein
MRPEGGEPSWKARQSAGGTRASDDHTWKYPAGVGRRNDDRWGDDVGVPGHVATASVDLAGAGQETLADRIDHAPEGGHA